MQKNHCLLTSSQTISLSPRGTRSRTPRSAVGVLIIAVRALRHATTLAAMANTCSTSALPSSSKRRKCPAPPSTSPRASSGHDDGSAQEHTAAWLGCLRQPPGALWLGRRGGQQLMRSHTALAVDLRCVPLARFEGGHVWQRWREWPILRYATMWCGASIQAADTEKRRAGANVAR
jgi:hypothetical protein